MNYLYHDEKLLWYDVLEQVENVTKCVLISKPPYEHICIIMDLYKYFWRCIFQMIHENNHLLTSGTIYKEINVKDWNRLVYIPKPDVKTSNWIRVSIIPPCISINQSQISLVRARFQDILSLVCLSEWWSPCWIWMAHITRVHIGCWSASRMNQIDE